MQAAFVSKTYKIPRLCSLVPSPLLSLLLNIDKLDQSNPTQHPPQQNNSHRSITDRMSETVYNSHGISIDRFKSKWTISGFPTTRMSIRIKAGQTVILEVTETLRDGTAVVLHGEVLLSGKWAVRQTLNAPKSTITTDALPPAYSRLASATSSAEPAKDTETTIRVFDDTGVLRGVSMFEKRISIVSGQTPSSQLVLRLVMAADLDAGLVSPNPGCPVLHPGYIPTLRVDGSWNLRQRYRTTTPPVQPTNATTPNVFRRMSARIKTLGSSGTSKQPKEKEKEATTPAVKG
jgi:hypothetical protein